MNEPTQDLIVSELRRRVHASLADVTQVLGLRFASLIPQEIQGMKASGLVVYEEPLGPSSVLSLPQGLLPTCLLRAGIPPPPVLWYDSLCQAGNRVYEVVRPRGGAQVGRGPLTATATAN